jgi:hypothetical protein
MVTQATPFLLASVTDKRIPLVPLTRCLGLSDIKMSVIVNLDEIAFDLKRDCPWIFSDDAGNLHELQLAFEPILDFHTLIERQVFPFP